MFSIKKMGVLFFLGEQEWSCEASPYPDYLFLFSDLTNSPISGLYRYTSKSSDKVFFNSLITGLQSSIISSRVKFSE